MAKFVFTVIMMNVFCIFTLHANNTEDWEICGCNPPTYSLSFAGDPDYYAAGPEKTEYFLGEKVMLGYSNENVLDGYWVISPSSHLASGSRDTLVEIYMTDSTEASYFSAVSGSTRTITITNTCPTCGDVNPVGVQDVPYGEVIQITASPFGEKIPVWHGKPTNQTVDGGTQRLNENPEDGNYYLNFHAIGNYTLRCEWKFPPTGELRTGSVSWVGNGNAMIHTAGYESSHFSPSPFLHNSATTTHSTFDARCIPDPGCYLTHWQWNVGGVTKYRAGTAVVSGSSYILGEITLQQPQTDFIADVQQGISLNILTEGKGVVKSDDFRSSWNPKPYTVSNNGTVLNQLVSSNEVIIEASPCPGWGFHHWEVEGSVVESSPGIPSVDNLTLYMNCWEEPDEYHVPNGKSMLEVKAIFEETTVTGFNKTGGDEVPGNCFSSGFANGLLMFEYEWFSSTGNLMDLDGKIIEVICYDSSVSEEEIIACLERDRNDILNEPSVPDMTPCSEDIVEIDSLYAYAMGDLAGTPFVPVRFYHNAKSDASAGFLSDNNELRGPCWLSCEYAQVVTSQYFFHVPVCGQIDRVGGPFEITRNSSGDNMNFSLAKHGELLSSGCLWQECQCADFVPDCSCN